MINNKKISGYQLKKIILHFCVDIEASKTAMLTGINRNTINAYYYYFRELIADKQQEKIASLNLPAFDPLLVGSFQDLWQLLSSKITGKQMSGYPVYGLFEHNGQVFCEMIVEQFISLNNDQTISEKKAVTQYSKGFIRNYHAILFGMFPQLFIIKKNITTPKNGIQAEFILQSFWSFSKRRLGKFNGISKYFYYHLKECEWRWKKSETGLIAELTTLILESRK